jgi:hypothetical protein
MSVAFARRKARLIIRRRAVQDRTSLEGELGSAPRTHHRTLFQSAFRQRLPEVGAGMDKGLDASMLTDHEHIRILRLSTCHRVFR